ncbi:MAG: hypothetical protein KDC05_11475 [Bacteroidales bacterium]|nr:hypothetical protein [Bacteroidales bacterium]
MKTKLFNPDASFLLRIKKYLHVSTIVIFVLLALFLLYAIVLSMISSTSYVKTINKAYSDDSTTLVSGKNLISSGLHSEELFLEARLAMLTEDSITLSIDLTDSLIRLEMKGVVVHTARISKIQVSRIFRYLNYQTKDALFGKPFTTGQTIATIPKTEYLLKKVSADSLIQPGERLPDTTHEKAICFLLHLDKNIMIDIRQSGCANDDAYQLYAMRLKRDKYSEVLKGLLKPAVPKYSPVIGIELAKNDARTIYKALPDKPRLALRL